MTTATSSRSTRGRLWGEVWRSLLAAGAGALVLAALSGEHAAPYNSSWWAPVDFTMLAVWLTVLHFRRRWPFPVAIVLAAASAISATSVGAMGIALISLATHRNRRQIAATCAVAFLAGMAFQVFAEPGGDRGDWITNVVFTILILAFCLATGSAIGARRELVAGLQARLQDAQREQVLRAAQAKIAERARIAREMHDVLAHRISLVVMHSGALAYRTDASVQEVRASSAIIRDNAELALTELREVLGVLRDPDSRAEVPNAPQPTLADLPSLIEQVRASDGPVTFEGPHTFDGISDVVSRNAFRIVQECLTNRRKHAPGSPVRILLSRHAQLLTIEVRNPAPAGGRTADALPASGLGLVGLTERAVLSGGELTYGMDRSDHFVVRASLPWAP